MFWAAVVSGIFCLFKWIGSLLGTNEPPAWGNFIGGGIGIFAFLFLYKTVWLIKDTKRRIEDPVYDELSKSAGLSYKDYKKFKDEKKQDK